MKTETVRVTTREEMDPADRSVYRIKKDNLKCLEETVLRIPVYVVISAGGFGHKAYLCPVEVTSRPALAQGTQLAQLHLRDSEVMFSQAASENQYGEFFGRSKIVVDSGSTHHGFNTSDLFDDIHEVQYPLESILTVV